MAGFEEEELLAMASLIDFAKSQLPGLCREFSYKFFDITAEVLKKDGNSVLQCHVNVAEPDRSKSQSVWVAFLRSVLKRYPEIFGGLFQTIFTIICAFRCSADDSKGFYIFTAGFDYNDHESDYDEEFFL